MTPPPAPAPAAAPEPTPEQLEQRLIAEMLQGLDRGALLQMQTAVALKGRATPAELAPAKPIAPAAGPKTQASTNRVSTPNGSAAPTSTRRERRTRRKTAAELRKLN